MLKPLPSWSPVYLVVLLAAVLSPFAISCAPIAWTHGLEALDFALNVLFFVPIAGLVQPKHRLRPIILGLALSLFIELVQRHLFRSPNVWDLLANTFGAALILGISTFTGAEGLVWLAHTTPSASFETWTDMPLVLGCEQGSKPSFRGGITGLAIYDQPLKAPQPIT